MTPTSKTALTQILYEILPPHLWQHIDEFTDLLESLISGALSEDEVNRRISDTYLRELVHELEAKPIAVQEQLGLLFERRNKRIVMNVVGRDHLNLAQSTGAIVRPSGSVKQYFFEILIPEPPPITACTGVLTKQHVSKLKKLIKKQHWQLNTVLSCYLHCIPQVGWTPVELSRDPQKVIFDMIDNLQRFGTTPTAPLLEFVECLARDAVDLYEQFLGWVNETSCAIGWDRQRLEQLRNNVRNRSKLPLPTNPHLFVAIIPSPPQSEMFSVRSWIWTDQYWWVLTTSDKTYSMAEVQQEVVRQLNEALPKLRYELLSDQEDTIIAFIVPHTMLLEYIDQWEVNISRTPRALGEKYSVVVRSVERLIEDEYQELPHWRPIAHPNTVVWPELEDVQKLDPNALIKKLEHAGCLALAFVPERDQDGYYYPLRLAIDIGIPVALWPRHTRHLPTAIRQACEAKIAQHLADHDLPRQLKALRTCGDPTEQELWQDIALLWDDPERKPRITYPAKGLRAPR